jgi:hypothetical protein
VPIVKDIWRVGVLDQPAQALLAPEVVRQAKVAWLPKEGPLRFIADPFPLRRDGRLHLFVEAYDYRDRTGRIDVITFDEAMQPLARETALAEPWHLSYPFVWEADGHIWMAPEAHRSGLLTLYRAERFPTGWRAVRRITLDAAPIDATPVFHGGLWWLFYTPATTRMAKVAHLHLAYAERLDGPWRTHPGNPVRRDAGSARPGGAPFVHEGRLVLPVQDCRRTYGGAIRALVIHELTPTRFEAEAGPVVRAPPALAPQLAGLHTWSGAGPVTFIDAKRRVVTPSSLWLDLRREAGKLRAGFRT